ncbi:MAG TPA: heparan-alpha-glucosaminide N-acetyltransferase domain-containing protein [Rhodothermales bacterium]
MSVTETAPAASAERIQLGLEPSSRLISLDAFRGITIAGMILVNDPGTWGAIYEPLEHADWHGWTPTDLVFPFFLFIVGVAITFTYRKRLARGDARGKLVSKAVRRTLVLIALGLLLSAIPFTTDFSQLRFPGVLQRIAVCYLAGTVLFLFTTSRTQTIVGGALLLGYWMLMTLVPVPGYGAGLIDQPESTLAAHIDRVVFGPGHLWEGADRMWDPEGILSTLPAIVTVLLGIWAGHMLQRDQPASERVARMLAWGFVLIIAGYVWDWFFPINKKIWTSSYTLFTAGLAMSALALCYRVIDILGHRRWAQPFVVFGMNAIGIYVVAGVVATLLYTIPVGGRSLHEAIYQNVFAPIGSPQFSSMLFALAFVGAMYLVAWAMYRRRIFLKV